MFPVGAAERPEPPCHAADLYPVRMTQKRKLNGYHGQHLQHVPSLPEALRHIVRIMQHIFFVGIKSVVGLDHVVIAIARMQRAVGPDHGAVLVDGEHQLLGRAAFGRNQIAERHLRVDKILIVRCPAQQCFDISRRRAVVMVHGKIVHGVKALLQYRLLPLGIVVHKRS